MHRGPWNRRGRRRPRTLVWLTASAMLALAYVGHAQQSSDGRAPLFGAPGQHTIPQTGGSRQSCPQPPGAPRDLNLQAQPAVDDAAPEFALNQVLVQFQAGTPEADRAAVRAALNSAVQRQLRGPDGGLELLSTPLDVPAAVQLV